MLKIRKNVFETNSSSTHTIAIPKDLSSQAKELLKSGNHYIHFTFGEYGWEEDNVPPASYLYTGLYDYFCNDPETLEKMLNYIKETLDMYGIKYEFDEPCYNKRGGWLEFGYVDHSCELSSFFNAIFSDSEKLIRYLLFGEVFTGNDNRDYDEETEAEIFRKEHMDDYDFYFKGN